MSLSPSKIIHQFKFLKTGAIISGILSCSAVILAAVNDLENVAVYKKTEDFLWKKVQRQVVIREYDPSPTNISNMTYIAGTTDAKPTQKVVFALGGVALGLTCLVLLEKREEIGDCATYAEAVQATLDKNQIDLHAASKVKVDIEESVITTHDLLSDLFKNPHWVKLQAARKDAQEGVEDALETQNDVDFNPFVDDPVATQSESLDISIEKLSTIDKLLKEGLSMSQILLAMFQVKEGTSEYVDLVQKVRTMLD
jgi:hypothetical protein